MLEIKESSETMEKSLLYFNIFLLGLSVILFLSEWDKVEIKIRDRQLNEEYQGLREAVQILKSMKVSGE